MKDLSGNPSSERPLQIAEELRRIAARFEDEAFKSAWEALTEVPDRPIQEGYTCPCCMQSLLEDAAVMLDAFAETAEGKELEESY